jgi:hypothetical protein
MDSAGMQAAPCRIAAPGGYQSAQALAGTLVFLSEKIQQFLHLERIALPIVQPLFCKFPDWRS